MSKNSTDLSDLLTQFGERLRQHRVVRNIPQADFARQIGVSLPTYRKLESGHPGATIGVLARALALLGREADLQKLLGVSSSESLFDRFDRERLPREARATRKRP